MGTDEEVLKIGKKLDRICQKKESPAQALDLLNALKKIPVDLEVLQKTRIGMTVNSLRKQVNDDQVVLLSKTLIKSWKKLLDDQKNNSKLNKEDSNDSTNGNSPNSAAKLENGSSKTINSNLNNGKTSSPAVTNNNRPPQSCFNKHLSFPMNTTDSVRLKCREMLCNAMSVDFGDDIDVKDEILEDPENLAAKIEDCIFKEFKDTNMKYKNRIRSRVANLKDAKNPDLRLNVLRGQISVQRISTMSSEEMASNEMKELRQKFTKEAINDAQMSVQGGTQTDLIKCPKCKKSNTTYNQVQTRSADEPMTTFCYCNECGKRWKFC